MKHLSALIVFCLGLSSLCQDDDPMASPEGYLKYDIKKGASLNSDYESVGYWNGSVYSWKYSDNEDWIPTYEKLFLFEGFNIRRAIREEDGHYTSLSREVSLYKDKDTGKVDVLIW